MNLWNGKSKRMDKEQINYIDESGFNLWLARTHGWAHVGQRAVRVVGTRKDPISHASLPSPTCGLLLRISSRWNTYAPFQQLLQELLNLPEMLLQHLFSTMHLVIVVQEMWTLAITVCFQAATGRSSAAIIDRSVRSTQCNTDVVG